MATTRVCMRPAIVLQSMVCCLMMMASSPAQIQEVKINDLARHAETYVGQKVTVQGRLILAGRNYFTDPRFVLVDEQGETIPVSAWAPLDFPPPMPGSEAEFEKDPNSGRNFKRPGVDTCCRAAATIRCSRRAGSESYRRSSARCRKIGANRHTRPADPHRRSHPGPGKSGSRQISGSRGSST
jgi:hypothetical protein